MSNTSRIIPPVSNFRLYGTIEKVTEESDGTLRVEGICSSEIQDVQGETVTASAMEKAIPGYLRKDGTGPLREMHQPIAAGKTTAIDVQPDGKTYVVTKVVDKGAVQKVKEKVLQGFSIGGHVPPGGRNKDNPKIIDSIVLSEISLVDRPANPDAVFTLVKLADGAPVQVPADEAKKTAPAANPNPPAPTLAAAPPAPAGGAAPVAPAEVEVTIKVAALDAEQVRKFVASPAFLVAAKGDDLSARIAEAEKATDAAGSALRKALVDRDELARKLADANLVIKAKGVPQDPKHLEAAVKAEELQKAVADAQDATQQAGAALKKVMVERADLVLERDVLKKQLEESVTKYTTSLTELSEQKEELAKQRDEYVKKFAVAKVQLETKGYLKAVPVEKRDDTRDPDEPESKSAKPAEGTPERVLYEIKKVQRTAGTRFLPSPNGG